MNIVPPFFFCAALVFIQQAVIAAPVHPRGLITSDELALVRQNMQLPFYSQKLQVFEREYAKQNTPGSIAGNSDGYVVQKSLTTTAFLYAMTGKQNYGAKAAVLANIILADTLVYKNPLVKGLTRAAVFQSLATAYDLCYDAWKQPLREAVAQSLLQTAFSMQSTMGFEANYALESNWMGVRYGAVLYALMVTDERGKKQGRFHEGDMLEWDVRERLRDHISANMNPNGWSGESLGYHYYSWSFIAPALMAYENKVVGRRRSLAMLAPSCLNVVATHASMVAYIDAGDGFRAIKPDFSDDNIGVNPAFFLQAMRLYPKEQAPYIRWMVERIGLPNSEETLLYAAAWMPDTLVAQNPALAGWHRAVEETQGAIAFRNRFRDEHDVVAAFTTTAKRIRAHQSGDNLTFRIIGLDNIWVVGGGRTGLKAGQPTVFPTDSVSLTETYQQGATGQLLRYGFDQAGGFAEGSGSCMGVAGHRRYFRADYDSLTGASAVFLVRDQSQNGRKWRLTTPEWNSVKTTPTGFIITGPTGARMQVTVLQNRMPLQVRISKVKYNGTTSANASGIPYKGKRHSFITAIDVAIEQSSLIVMSLLPSGATSPVVSPLRDGVFSVGNKQYAVKDMD